MQKQYPHVPQISVAQLGARMYYGVASSFYQYGLLEYLLTDFYCKTKYYQFAAKLADFVATPDLRALVGRNAKCLPDAVVKSFPLSFVSNVVAVRCADTEDQRLRAWMSFASKFAATILPLLCKNNNSIFGFNSASVELFEGLSNGSRIMILEQTIAPRALEARIMSQERSRWSGWEQVVVDGSALADFTKREHREWALATAIVAPSSFVRDSLVAEGVSKEKVEVIPYGIPEVVSGRVQAARTGKSQTLSQFRVGFVGTIGLRKGFPYFAEAASFLSDDRSYEFVCVGGSTLNPDVVHSLEANVHMRGFIPRIDMPSVWSQLDALVLPSLCEGSATVVYEAMSHGIPVITTLSSGTLVTHEINGLIVPECDSKSIAVAIVRLRSEHSLRGAIIEAAFRTIEEYSQKRYGVELTRMYNSLAAQVA